MKPMQWSTLVLASLLWMSGSAWGFEVEIRDAWVRKNLPGQSSAATFASIRVDEPSRLIAAQSSVAGLVEFHRLDPSASGRVSLRAIPFIPLESGRTNNLSKQGYHIMLINLKEGGLQAGDSVPIQLKIQSDAGELKTINTVARVRGLTDR